MAVLLFAMTTAVMGCYQKETEPIDIPGRTPSGTSAPQPSATPADEVIPSVDRQAELAEARAKNPDTRPRPFADGPAGSDYYDAGLWAVENGITKGTGDTTFSPEATCSRAQIVTLLWRSEKSPAAGTANPFADVKSTAYYTDAVLWAVKENITKGTTSTTFSPNADCTRAQIVTFLWRCKK